MSQSTTSPSCGKPGDPPRLLVVRLVSTVESYSSYSSFALFFLLDPVIVIADQAAAHVERRILRLSHPSLSRRVRLSGCCSARPFVMELLSSTRATGCAARQAHVGAHFALFVFGIRLRWSTETRVLGSRKAFRNRRRTRPSISVLGEAFVSRIHLKAKGENHGSGHKRKPRSGP